MKAFVILFAGMAILSSCSLTDDEYDKEYQEVMISHHYVHDTPAPSLRVSASGKEDGEREVGKLDAYRVNYVKRKEMRYESKP